MVPGDVRKAGCTDSAKEGHVFLSCRKAHHRTEPGLEHDTEAESEISRVDEAPERSRAGDLAEATETLHRTIRIQRHVRHVRARGAEVRVIRGVERFPANLDFKALREPDVAEEIQVEIGGAWPAKLVRKGQR